MRLHFIEQGQGFPLLLLHGFPFDHTLWQKVCKLMPDDVRIITPDLRGFGTSKTANYQYSMYEIACDVVALLNELSIQKAVIAGHSMGGYVALEMARSFAKKVGGIVLVASHIYADLPEKRKGRLDTIKNIETSEPGFVLSSMPEKLSLDEDVQGYCRTAIQNADRKGVMGALYAMANRPSAETVWSGLKIPALIIAGEKDQYTSLETSKRIAESNKNAILEVIKDTGHMPMLELPEAVANALIRYIKIIRSK